MTSPREFWSWFADNAERLLALPGEALVDEVYDRLVQVDDRLGIEVSAGPTAGGERELIVTAYALRDAIPVARDLAAQAPALPGWKVIGLRPGRGFGFTFRNDDGELQGTDIRFVPLSAPGQPAHLKLVLPVSLDSLPEGERQQLGWQMLNAGLGELLAAQVDELDVVGAQPGQDGDVGEPIERLAGWLG